MYGRVSRGLAKTNQLLQLSFSTGLSVQPGLMLTERRACTHCTSFSTSLLYPPASLKTLTIKLFYLGRVGRGKTALQVKELNRIPCSSSCKPAHRNSLILCMPTCCTGTSHSQLAMCRSCLPSTLLLIL